LARIIYSASALLTLLTTILFCGISRDPEFYEPTIFVKHRPTMKVHFYTPTGESDLTVLDLSAEDKKEELLYIEFVEDQKIYTDNLNRLWFLPPILIQVTLTFLAFAITTQNEIKPDRLIIHFLINVIPTTAIVSLMLFNEKPWQLFVFSVLLLITNIWTLKLTERKSNAQKNP
jgi:hypothetical protein